MTRKGRIYFESAGLSLEENDNKLYKTIFLGSESSGNLSMDTFYLPRRSIRTLEKSFSKGKISNEFTAYHELSAKLFRDGDTKDIDYFLVEKVVHSRKLEEIARAFFAYRITPRD